EDCRTTVAMVWIGRNAGTSRPERRRHPLGRSVVLALLALVLVAGACTPFSAAESPGDGGPLPGLNGSARDVAVPRFCASSLHAFCADFDGPGLKDGWSESTEELGGALAAIEGAHGSSSRSLVATLARREAETGRVQLRKVLETPWRKVVVAFDLFVEK